MTREELVAKVALKMDEISSSNDVIVTVVESDNNPLYTQINELLNESINEVLTKAPIYRIKNQIAIMPMVLKVNGGEGTYTTDVICDGTRKSIVIDVPDDFIRIVSITDEKFQRPIVDLAIEGDRIDVMQHNKFLVAGTAKPVAVIGRDIYGKRTITCYSYAAGDEVSPNVLYIKRYNEEDLYKETGLDEYMTEAVSWVCAGKVFSTRGDVNHSKICDENAMALMV
jgi:hypothetical protein